MKTVTIPIINDNDYEPDKEFYIILKNPEGEAALGDPSIARAMIIDDDGRYNARKVCPSISFSAWVFKWHIEDLVRSTIHIYTSILLVPARGRKVKNLTL